MRKSLFLILISICSLLAYAQAPHGINYQAVARGITGQVMSNSNITAQITILSGSTSGTVKYSETHFVTTNTFGLFTLTIGDGTPVTGTFSNISWGTTDHFLRVEIDPAGGSDYITVSETQMMSVPYALYAESSGGSVTEIDADTTNELQTLTKTGTSLSLSKGGGTVFLGDEDPVNELQTITKAGTSVSLSNGGSFVLNDDNSSNEIQTLTKSGNTLTLSNSGGSITLGDEDDTNELQSVSKIGNTVTLSQFGGDFTVDDADANPSNELQTVSRTGNNITLSQSGGSVSVNDADSSTTNELQTISIAGNIISLTNGGGNVNLDDNNPFNELQAIQLNIDTLILTGGGGRVILPDASKTNELQNISKTGIVATLSQGGGSFISPDTLSMNYIIAYEGYVPNVAVNNYDGAMVGEVKLFAGNFAPTSWMFCQGQLLDRATYPLLFNVIGTTYGSTSANNFALPDLRQRIPVQH
jgi:hypothetical protein